MYVCSTYTHSASQKFGHISDCFTVYIVGIKTMNDHSMNMYKHVNYEITPTNLVFLMIVATFRVKYIKDNI